MKRNIKYSLILSATLALSFCQGKQSSVFDPTQGQNAATAQQYLNSGSETRVLPESIRSQRYSLSYTTAQADNCINTAAETGELSVFCNQIVNDYLTKTYGVNYQNFTPENIAIAAPNGRTFDYNTSDRLSAQNAPWLPQYQQYIGGTDPSAAGYFRPAYNMQSLCGGNPQSYTNVRVNCGNYNWGYGTIAVNGNTGLNYMNQGQFNRAVPIFQPGGTVQTLCTSRCPHLYEGAFYRTNMGQKNKELERRVNDQWAQIKQTPKHMGLSILSGALGIVDGVAANVESRINNSLSNVAANQYAQAYNNDQYTAMNNAMIDQYVSAQDLCQQSTIQAVAESPCPQDQFQYRVNNSGDGGNEYRVLTCGGI